VRRRRKERKQFVLIDFFVASEASASYSAISAVDAAIDAERILADAPPKVREALMMRYGGSESWSDVAARTATSPGAIRKKCKRCLDRIRQKLGIPGAAQ
jgi:DNA-directed RNA polymerase specialized sigma24 family protein